MPELVDKTVPTPSTGNQSSRTAKSSSTKIETTKLGAEMKPMLKKAMS